MDNLAPICVAALIFVCVLGQDLGDAKLGNRQEPYKPTPMCIQADNTYKPCQQ